MKAFVQNISSVNTDALIVGIVSLAILILAPYIFKKVPGSLIAVIVGILMVQFLPLKVSTIGNLYTISNSLPSFHMPAIRFSTISASVSNAFTIAVLAAIESLLSCVVADGMINSKHRSDMELVAPGAQEISLPHSLEVSPQQVPSPEPLPISKMADGLPSPEWYTPSHSSSCWSF